MPAPGDLIHQQSTSTGTGNITLTAVNGKRTFNDEFGTGGTNKFDYFISNQAAAEWERGTGHLSASTTLVRDTVLASSNANAAVNFSAGTKDIANDVPAALQVRGPGSATVGNIALWDSSAGNLLKDAGYAPREVLTSNRTYYVRSDGADTNTGLANTSGGAFKTLQKAINAACALDFSLYSVTIRLADGTYTPGKFSVPTNGKIIIDGNATTPANVVVSGSTPIEVAAACDVTIQNFEAQGSSYALRTAAPGAALTIGVGMRCTGSGTAISVNNLSSISSNGGSLLISGNKPYWLSAVGNCSVQLFSMTITFSGTPAWSNVGISFAIGAAIYMYNVTMIGAATGTRYYGNTNAVLHSSGAGTASTYFPGNANGGVDTGAQQL